ncbi:NAD(P)H-hydrate epimerase, partial [Lysobacter xanthus]
MRDLLPLFDIDSLRRFEAAAIAATGGDDALMERAGRAAWQHLLACWPAAMRLAVVCGTGGNGGDGYVLARLAHESGRDVVVVDAADEPRRHAAAARAQAAFVEAGGRVGDGDALPPADVVVDALLGIGLEGEPRPRAAALIDAMNAQAAPVFSLDVPSGVDARGVPGGAVRASATLEFLLPKATLRTGPARECAGRIDCAPLDVPGDVDRPEAT